MSAVSNRFSEKRGFTLIELMIVMVIIGILMGGIFRMMKIVGDKNRKATTVARLQCLQNAISGFYSSYGIYPPVPVSGGYSDPFAAVQNESVFSGQDAPGAGSAKAARMAARAQPVAFQFPHGTHLDEMINRELGIYHIRAANEVYDSPETYDRTKWADIQMFQFGLMSFILPRVYVARDSQSQPPRQPFFSSLQWSQYNKTGGGLAAQRDQELREAAKWISNLEGAVCGYAPTILNVNIRGGVKGDRDLDNTSFGEADEALADGTEDERRGFYGMAYRGPYDWGSQRTLLLCTTSTDGWDQEFYYYSPPPHNTYRLWSAGPNRNTFPPWIPLESLNDAQRKQVKEWIEDDIVGFDR